MNQEWSQINKTIQMQLKKEVTFDEGIKTMISLRKKLMKELLELKSQLQEKDFCAIPYLHANGYHNKTIAYTIWHIFRIEDVVANSLIMHHKQVFFSGNYQSRIHSPIITTGNELVKQQIVEFSKALDLDELYTYAVEVMNCTNELLKNLSYKDLKRKMTSEDKEYLKSLHVVSEDEQAIWLLDYWCEKDIKGNLQMPFTRHWIMHIEACLRIYEKIRLRLK